MRLVWNDAICPWVAAQIGAERGFDPCVGGAVVDAKGNIAAGVILHNYCPESGVIEITAAAVNRKWAQRGVMAEILDYAFRRAGCQSVVARCEESNKAARKIWVNIGAQEFILPRLRGRNANECVHILTDDAWASSRFSR